MGFIRINNNSLSIVELTILKFLQCVEDGLLKILSLIKPSKEYVCAQYFLEAANQLIEAQKNEVFYLTYLKTELFQKYFTI